jgi:CheY-like chemotaxis protein
VKLYLENIQTVSKDAGQIVRRLSDFYRKRKATSTINRAIAIDALVQSAIELTQPRWQVQARGADKQIEVHTKLQAGTTIAGTEAKLRELFTNLIFNATDAITGKGTITITTCREGEEVLIKVADTGEGMPPDVLARCFEPFYTTKDEKGSGLGMAIVYGVVQRHSGHIEVDSVAGSGTVIGIRLPITHGEQVSIPIEETKVVRGLRILLVEDKAHIREYLSEILKLDEHIVTTATDGREGLDAFEPEMYDLVVTDQSMPEMNGDHMALAIREESPSQPIIMITGFGDLMRATEECPEHISALLSKPCTRSGIRRAIRQVMG